MLVGPTQPEETSLSAFWEQEWVSLFFGGGEQSDWTKSPLMNNNAQVLYGNPTPSDLLFFLEAIFLLFN